MEDRPRSHQHGDNQIVATLSAGEVTDPIWKTVFSDRDDFYEARAACPDGLPRSRALLKSRNSSFKEQRGT
jgi:hypothetical protein